MINPQRLCAKCKIHWDKERGLECPKRGAHPVFTFNDGDIGTAIYFENSDDNISAYKKWENPPHQGRIKYTGANEMLNKIDG